MNVRKAAPAVVEQRVPWWRRMDGWAEVSLWGSIITGLIGVFLAFIVAPPDKILGDSQRIFYFHLPANIMCFVAFVIYFVAAIGYWRTRKRDFDVLMLCALEVGILFSLMGVVSGSIWGAYAWGTFWTWDPRLTTVTIMLVVYIGGLMLRASLDDPAKKAALLAAFGIIGFINVPLVFFASRWFRSIHPVLGSDDANGQKLDATMYPVILFCMIPFSFLLTYFLVQRVRLELERDAIEASRQEIEDIESENVNARMVTLRDRAATSIGGR